MLSFHVSGGFEEEATAAGVVAVARVGALRGGAVDATGRGRAHSAQPARAATEPLRREAALLLFARPLHSPPLTTHTHHIPRTASTVEILLNAHMGSHFIHVNFR